MAVALDQPTRGYGTVIVYTNREQDSWRAACTECSYRSRANRSEGAIITRAKNHRCATPVQTVPTLSEDKAHRYLVEGRVRVLRADRVLVRAEVRGSAPQPYTVAYDGVGWACNCEARVPLCAHIVAVQMVTSPGRIGDGGASLDDPFSKLLGPRWAQHVMETA
jgi:hypothetical protein